MESSFLVGKAEVSTWIVFFFGSSFNWKGKNALTLNAGRERSEPPAPSAAEDITPMGQHP